MKYNNRLFFVYVGKKKGKVERESTCLFNKRYSSDGVELTFISSPTEELFSIVIVDNIFPPCDSETTCLQLVFPMLLPCLVAL